MGSPDLQTFPEAFLTELARVSPSAVKVLLEERVKERDQDIRNQLLKKLLIQYSASEFELHRLNQLKNKLLGMAAHDMRNPLISLRGLSDILLAQDVGSLTDDQRELLTIMRQASHGLINLVNDLLDISVIESGNLQLNCQPADLVDLTRQRTHLLQLHADQKSIEIRIEDQDPMGVTMDSHRMAQVIDNLVGNAVKFSPSDSVVKIHIHQGAETVRWQVSDQGPGISSEEVPLLFGAFQKLSSKPTAGESSTGLGLAISQKIVTAHGGHINVTSKLGQGSLFEVVLPVGECHE